MKMTLSGYGFFATLISLLILSVPFVSLAEVGINPQIPFSGVLKDSKGKEIVEDQDIHFAIYENSEGGVPLWEETHSAVKMTEGSFRVLLGSILPFADAVVPVDFSDDTYYLGVTVVGEDSEMTPRERLGASPYAFNTKYFEGLPLSDFFRSGQVLNVSTSTDNTLLTLDQMGDGDLLSISSGGTEIFSILNDGGINVFGGNPSYFDGDIQFAQGNGVSFGGLYAGIKIWQDSDSDPNLLMFELHDEAETITDNRIILASPSEIFLMSNYANPGGPNFELKYDGSARLYNNTQGTDSDRIFDVDFTNGMKVTNGNFRVSDGDVKIGVGEPQSKLDVDGTILATGLDVDGTIFSTGLDITGTMSASSLSDGLFTHELLSDENGVIKKGPPVVSDIKFKENIQTIDGALDMILNLRGVRYEWKNKEQLGTQSEIGFIAQEVQEIVPEVVQDNGEYLSINIKNIVAVVVEAIKELNTKVEEYFARTERLEREVADLRAEIDALKGSSRVESTQVETQAEEEVVPENTEVALEVVVEPTPEPETVPEPTPEPEVVQEPVITP